MTRILLPLAIVAAIFFGPMFAEQSKGAATGAKEQTVAGEYFIGNAIDCLRAFKAPIGEACASDGVINDSSAVGQVITWASLLAIAAALLSIIGLLPIIGRLTSIVTILAGLGAIGSMGYLALALMATKGVGLPGMQWGAYLTAAIGLLTVISGLSGLRGKH